ncbi:DUF4439 domain-containing protein [Corynebacterium sp. 3HC-13]|uniref:DUF4439 domain-containing protein n=1 Tax=Corynebacterium poyangense TaxID=2684405 RepID=UPI001CCBE299|nr:DUF4439 domain-containing protein [Corynebacterium poyangense]MBZ8178024.1 DUF4439 domain-containing protein [Corynebacterium poyangense]
MPQSKVLKFLTRRSIVGVCLTSLALSMTSCGVLGPRPDSTLVSLAGQALKDSHTWADSSPRLAKLRGTQAERLLAEIARDCGTYQDGRILQDCQLDNDQVESHGIEQSPEDSFDTMVASIDDTSQGSRDLITDLAFNFGHQLLADSTTDGNDAAKELPQPPALPTKDQDEATTLLQQEYSTIWGLDSVQGFSSANALPSLSSLGDCHRHSSAALEQAFQLAKKTAPEAAPGYQIPAEKIPADTHAAQDFAVALQQNSAQEWKKAMSLAKDDAWRLWLTRTAIVLDQCSQ